ncbi:MAG: hypothetical protein J6E46_05250 [Faecalicoccus sp.]|nr:hypothetical protein [Faecalicoccus sp.]
MPVTSDLTLETVPRIVEGILPGVIMILVSRVNRLLKKYAPPLCTFLTGGR